MQNLVQDIFPWRISSVNLSFMKQIAYQIRVSAGNSIEMFFSPVLFVQLLTQELFSMVVRSLHQWERALKGAKFLK